LQNVETAERQQDDGAGARVVPTWSFVHQDSN
jgi:hypothetical protein